MAGEIPEAAVEALATELAVHSFGQADPSGVTAYRPIAERMLQAVETAWPHDPLQRDQASTVNSVTAFGAQRSAPPQRRFGFGPAEVRS